MINKISQKLHQRFINQYRVRSISRYLCRLLPDNQRMSGLDVGCGTGEISHRMRTQKPPVNIIGAEINLRKGTLIEVVEFNGQNLPFSNDSFDFVMLVDVLHHVESPEKLLAECSRVARQFLLIKDHFAETHWDIVRLRLMDWIGNYFYNIPLPFNYLSRQRWKLLFQKNNLVNQETINQLNIYPRLTSFLFNKNLHFISKLNLSKGKKDDEYE
ncbi:class I SAM-dependent methyltransferase [Candidatus Falkowbacteria bacterium]|nr:class I SAM-dependent methyltransferase [Candidatus Falkowbacteria bacterium]